MVENQICSQKLPLNYFEMYFYFIFLESWATYDLKKMKIIFILKSSKFNLNFSLKVEPIVSEISWVDKRLWYLKKTIFFFQKNYTLWVWSRSRKKMKFSHSCAFFLCNCDIPLSIFSSNKKSWSENPLLDADMSILCDQPTKLYDSLHGTTYYAKWLLT